ncbi:hypothetical protein Gogos_019431 [Gossypium gossypioides]|uniref:Uncharacterized protein n=1 Tax=Gossypium gossypioides TaxID=34282 RepID=A0A7J9BHD6_GOSGO|nr:hypothetical protein [Gossypium gossypioides]
MEQYFHVMGIEDDATKVNTVVTFLWWHRSEKEDFYWFEDRLKPWVKHELSRQGITELTIVMADAEFFVELGPKKDKFESSRPKDTCNGGGDHEKDE